MRAESLEEANLQATAAAKHVPESRELQEVAAYYQGLTHLFKENNCVDAAACFSRCSHMPPGFHVRDLAQRAAVGAAFDKKDYEQFLQLAEELAKQNPNDGIAQAQVASALACLYAVRGDESLRRRAEEKLEASKKLDAEAIKNANYEERIRHRLTTREIIRSEEFEKRFPNGWKPAEKPKP